MSQGPGWQRSNRRRRRSDWNRAGGLAALLDQDSILSAEGDCFSLNQVSGRTRLHFKKSTWPLKEGAPGTDSFLEWDPLGS